MVSTQEKGGLQQSPPAADGSESIDSKINSPINETIFQSWPSPVIGEGVSVHDDDSIKIDSIPNTSSTTMEKDTCEGRPRWEEAKLPIIEHLQHEDISDLKKDRNKCVKNDQKETKTLSYPIIERKGSESMVHGTVIPQQLSLEVSHTTPTTAIDGTSEKTVHMMNLNVPIKSELKVATSDVCSGIGDAFVGSVTCKGLASTTADATATSTIPEYDDKGKNEPAADSNESQEGGTVCCMVPTELKSEPLIDNSNRDDSSGDLSELISISQLIAQKKLKGKAGGAHKPKVGPGEVWVKGDLGLSVDLINKLLELISVQMTNANKTLKDTWCGCGMALKLRLPQHAPAIDWESVSKEINDETWTPKLCQAVWKYLAYADLTVADLLANSSLAVKDELEEHSDQDDYFIDSLKLNRKDVTSNKRKRLWGRGIINWPYYEAEDKGSVISLMQGPKKPKSRRRTAMSARTAPLINLCPPIACGPQTGSSKLRQPPPAAVDMNNSLSNVAKLPIPIPVPVLDIDMVGTSTQTPAGHDQEHGRRTPRKDDVTRKNT